MLPLKLQVLLFYIHKIRKADLAGIKPSSVRRANAKAWKLEKRIAEYPSPEMNQVDDVEIEVRDGAKIPVRIYKPLEADTLKTIVFYHGGGFVLRNIDTHDNLCRRTAKNCNALVISVGYRLAPEAKFPIPVEDCYDAFLWAAENASTYGGNPNDLVVMGDSAGANLATVVSHLARDNNGPKISKQVLIYPCLDARLQAESIEKFKDGYLLTKNMMEWFVGHYADKPEDILNPLMSPLLADNLADLPPALIIAADHDPLRDEDEAYYHKLKAAGNDVIFKEYKNTIHAFANIPRIQQKAFELDKDVAQFLLT